MKNYKGILAMGLFVFSTSIHAQTTIISGEMVDSVSHQGEPNATFRVYKAPDMEKPVVMGITDADGKFSQPVTGEGKYTVLFSSAGRKKITREVNLTKDGGSLNLGALLVQDETKQLQGVEVVAQKPLVKLETGKMTYDVQADADVHSNTVLDMLRKVPMVVVDGQDNITVNGSSSFKVYVDGKPNTMFSANPSQIFKSMPASLVKKIEVLTHPGAKYDAEGTTGVLNIVMSDTNGKKQRMNGYNGSLSAEVGNRQYRQSGFFSGQQGKLTYSTNVMHYHGNQPRGQNIIDRTSLTDGTTTHTENNDKRYHDFSMASINLSYDLDSLNTISTAVGINRFSSKGDSYGFDMITAPGTAMTTSITRNGLSNVKNYSFNASADYQHFFNSERTKNLIFSYLFDTSLEKNNSYLYYAPSAVGAPAAGTDYHLLNRPRSYNHTFQLDYTTPLWKNNTLNVGAKFISRTNKANSQHFDILSGNETYNANSSSNYKNTQSILAFYAEEESKFGKFSTKAGLRYEQTWEDAKFLLGAGSNFKKTYGNLVPSASVTYHLKDAMSLGLNYNMRISRPGIWELNPFVTETATTKSYGNPNLSVSKSHNISLEFNSFTPKLMFNATLSGILSTGGYDQYSFLVGQVMHSTYGNIIRGRDMVLDLFINYSPTANTRLSLNANGAYFDHKAEAIRAHTYGWGYGSFLSLQQKLPWKINLTVFSGIQGPQYDFQNVSKALGFAGATVSRDFFKDKLNVSMRYFNVLDDKLRFRSHIFGSTYDGHSTFYLDIMQYGITLTWKFGNTKQQFQTQQSRIKNDFSSGSKNNSGGVGNIGGGM